MDIFTQLVFVVGRLNPSNVEMLGTAFLVTKDGFLATTHHVAGSAASNLVILAPHIRKLNDYQDISDPKCRPISVDIVESDPIRDLAILKADITFGGTIPTLGTFDNTEIGSEIGIFGFPHCVEGRRALTYQKAEIGAKVLMEASGIKAKHAVINIQSRPGQSGSPVFSLRDGSISGVLIGAWAPVQGSVMLNGINPRELHQTTHCVSAEYVKDML